MLASKITIHHEGRKYPFDMTRLNDALSSLSGFNEHTPSTRLHAICAELHEDLNDAVIELLRDAIATGFANGTAEAQWDAWD